MHNDRAAQIIGKAMDRERREAARSSRISRAVLATVACVIATTLASPAPAKAGIPPAAIIREIWDWLTGRPPQHPPTPDRPLVKTKLVVGGSEG